MEIPTRIPVWLTPMISVVCLSLEFSALLIGYLIVNQTLLNIVSGAIVVQATTAVNYWLGSSSGSQRKSETIAALKPTVPPC